MSALVSAFGAGLLFGLGLWVSGMANPAKVLGFLDVAGRWDPSLAFVMAGAVGVTAIAFPLALRRGRPFFEGGFRRAELGLVDASLVAGSALFGIGWGIAGFCPGPGLTALASLTAEASAFVAAMIAGGLLHRLVARPSGLPDEGPSA